MYTRKLLNKLVSVGAFLSVTLPTTALAAPPPGLGCPEGWVPRPPELNPALGKCVPGTIKPNTGPQLILALPDLKVKSYKFISKKSVKVAIANIGSKNVGRSVLQLTVRRINGTPVGRQTRVKVPSIPKGQVRTVIVPAKHILPVNVSLKQTTFRLDADSTQAINELNENNNRRWHNL